jgi:hypothetical protein
MHGHNKKIQGTQHYVIVGLRHSLLVEGEESHDADGGGAVRVGDELYTDTNTQSKTSHA